MTLLYKRKSRLSIGPPGGELRRWEGLRLTFDVTKTVTPEPNKASIQIYNLSKDSRSRIQQKKDQVVLEVGYENDSWEELFRGEIRFVSNQKFGGDIATTIESGDSDTAWNDILLNETIGPGTSGVSVNQIFSRLKEIFTTEMKSIFGENAGVVPNFDSVIQEVSSKARSAINSELRTSTGKFRKGLTLTGSFGDVMKKLTERVGVDFFMNNQTLYVLKQDDILDLPALLFSPTTGLINIPRNLEKGGIQFQTLIVSGIIPGRGCVIKNSDFVDGDLTWKITRANFSGDNYGANWQATIDAALIAEEVRTAS